MSESRRLMRRRRRDDEREATSGGPSTAGAAIGVGLALGIVIAIVVSVVLTQAGDQTVVACVGNFAICPGPTYFVCNSSITGVFNCPDTNTCSNVTCTGWRSVCINNGASSYCEYCAPRFTPSFSNCSGATLGTSFATFNTLVSAGSTSAYVLGSGGGSKVYFSLFQANFTGHLSTLGAVFGAPFSVAQINATAMLAIYNDSTSTGQHLPTTLLFNSSVFNLPINSTTSVVPGTAPCACLNSFAVLGGSAVTVAGGPTVISGNLGSYPTPAVTGMEFVTFTSGSNHGGDALSQCAHEQAQSAYNNLTALGPGTVLSATSYDLTNGGPGRVGYLPGVYSVGSTLGITGTAVLDGQGDPNARFVFRVGSSMTTASSSVVELANGTQSCNVFWQMGASATLGTSSVFVGTIVALTSITVTTSATVDGRLIAINGAVTLDTNEVSIPTCGTDVCGLNSTITGSSAGSTIVPSPTMFNGSASASVEVVRGVYYWLAVRTNDVSNVNNVFALVKPQSYIVTIAQSTAFGVFENGFPALLSNNATDTGVAIDLTKSYVLSGGYTTPCTDTFVCVAA